MNLEPKIGRWACQCCEQDLFQIKNVAEVEEILSRLPGGEDDDLPEFAVFETEEEAIRALIPTPAASGNPADARSDDK